MRQRRLLGVAGLLLLGAMVGPPLAGSASTLFWNETADGNTAANVAARMYDRIYALPVGLIFVSDEERLPDVSLSIPCARPYLERMATGHWGTMLLEEAIRHHSARRLDILLKVEPAHAALLSLPPPALGALDACIDGSLLLSRFCEAYVRKITDKARSTPSPKGAEFADLVQRETEPVWCAAAQQNPDIRR